LVGGAGASFVSRHPPPKYEPPLRHLPLQSLPLQTQAVTSASCRRLPGLFSIGKVSTRFLFTANHIIISLGQKDQELPTSCF
jgi:hypothetical protein